MSIPLVYWIVFLFGLLLSIFHNRSNARQWVATDMIFWILFALLGWYVLGAPVHN
jgi:uncharacterized membrane protein